MKKYFRFLVPLFMILNLTTSAEPTIIEVSKQNKILTQQVDRLQKIKEKGVLTVLSSNNEPYSYKDPKTGEFIGIDAEIIKEAAKRLGIEKVDVRYTYFFNLLEELNKNPNIDIVVDGIYITDERKKLVDFTIPLYKDSDSILVRQDSNIKSKDDLKNAVVGANQGEVYDSIVKEWKSEGKIKDYVIFFERASARSALSSKVVDAFLTDSIISRNIIYKYPDLKFRLLTRNQYKPELTFNIGYPLKKEDTTLKNALDEKLQEMKNDGSIYQILSKYGIGENFVQ